MSLKGRITDDVKIAMKAGDKDRLKVLRLITAAIKQIEVDERRELDDASVLGVLDKMVKQRRDSITQFAAGNRDDLAAIEKAEISIIRTYLPKPLTREEIDELIDEAIATTGARTVRDMGKVMAAIKTKAQGRADLGTVGTRVKSRLNA